MSKSYRAVSGTETKPIETKRARRLRLAVCVFYVMTITFCALPYIQIYSEDGSIHTMTLFNMIVDGFRLGWPSVSIIAIIMVAVPVAGFLIEAFDKTRCIKCVSGMICSFAGIALICFGVGGIFSLGGLLSILSYIVIMFLSSYLLLVIREERRTELDKKEEAKPKHDFKLDEKDDSKPKHDFKIEK